MNNEKFVGVLLNGGNFDQYMLHQMKSYIIDTVNRLRAKNGKVTRQSLGSELGIERNRIVRIAKALKIMHIFE